MTFLNAALLGGLGAMAIPLILHLIRRRRFRVVRWGAMQLLEGVVSERRKTLDFEQILLVATRMAVLGVLALAMARPALTTLGAGFLRGSRTVAIVLDVSYSMGHGGRFEQSLEAAREVLRSLGENDVATLVLAAERPRVVFDSPVGDRDAIAAALEKASPIHGPARLGEAVLAALDVLARVERPVEEVFVLTDSQRLTWEGDTGERASLDIVAEALPLTGREGVADGAMPVITWIVVPGDGTPPQPFIERIELPRVTRAGERVPIRVRVVSPGAPGRGGTVSVRVDGIERGGTPLPPGGAGEAVVRANIDEPGSHWIEARLVESGARADARLLATLTARERIRALLVDGAPGDEPLGDETSFLRLALTPYGDDGSGGGAPGAADFDVETIAPAALETTELERFDVVVLANVTAVSREAAAALEGFARAGGGVVIFPGDRVAAASWNRDLGGLLPAALGERRTATGDPLGVRVAARREVGQRHAALGSLSSADLAGVGVRSWLALDVADRDATVVLAMETGEPFLVERRSGRGRVMLLATACDDDWSNLPTRPAYLPMMQQTLLHASTGAAAAQTLRPGEPIVLELPLEEAGRAAVVRLPDGQVVEGVTARGLEGALLEYRDTWLPGLYTVRIADESPAYFAVNADRAESDPAELSPSTLVERVEARGFDCVVGVGGVATALGRRRHGLEIWRPLVWLVTALLLIELVLEQWIGRGGFARSARRSR